MAEHDSHGPIGPTEAELKDSIDAGYEKNDVSIPVLLKWGAGLGIFLVATSAAMLILFYALQNPPFGPSAGGETIFSNVRVTPPAGTPVVQDNPAGDPRPDNNPRKGIDNIREFRRDEEIRMNEYAIQDGNLHIPLDRAMELSIQDFSAQKSSEAPTGVTPTSEMKIHPDTRTSTAPGVGGTAPSPARQP